MQAPFNVKLHAERKAILNRLNAPIMMYALPTRLFLYKRVKSEIQQIGPRSLSHNIK